MGTNSRSRNGWSLSNSAAKRQQRAQQAAIDATMTGFNLAKPHLRYVQRRH